MKIKIILPFIAVLLLSFTASEQQIITIFMVGDSTMANKPLDGRNPERGWGQVLGGYFDESIRIDNHAVNGRSSKSFIDEGRWETVRQKIRPGDYVFIQFGHNDEKTDSARHTDPGTTFDANLRRMAEEAIAAGATPVLFNSIVRRNFAHNPDAVANDDFRKAHLADIVEGDSLIETHGEYLASPRKVAAELGLTFIDLNMSTRNYVQQLGSKKSKSMYVWIPKGKCPAYPDGRQDNTHLNVSGARRVAAMAIDSIEAKIPELAKHIVRYDFVVAQDGSGDFFSLQQAIDATANYSENQINIRVRRGVYDEQITIPENKQNLTLVGDNGAIIRYESAGNETVAGSATMFVYAPNFVARNLTIENATQTDGDAPAVLLGQSATASKFDNCTLTGGAFTLAKGKLKAVDVK